MNTDAPQQEQSQIGLSLQVSDLSVRLGSRQVLRSVSFSVASGELVGILGPNGSGKSTLLRALSGVIPASAGEIVWDGCALTEYSSIERAQQIAHCRQESTLSLPFTSEELVRMGRHPHRAGTGWELGEDRTLIEAALAEADATEFRDRDVQSLSAGERQRVFLAKAFAQAPKLLLADEPTSAQDIAQSFKVLKALRRYAARPSAVLVVLHDLALATRYCDKLLLLNEGQPVQFGTTAEVLQNSSLAETFGVSLQVRPQPGGQGWQLDLSPAEPNNG